MGRNGNGNENIKNWQTTKINYGEHRRKYKKELEKLMLDIKANVNTQNVLQFYVLLKNYGIYTDDNIDSAYKYFEKNDKRFFERLEAYLSDSKNQRKVSNALELILKCINGIRDFSNNGFYQDLLDDLKVQCKLMIPTAYNNFIEPSMYVKNDFYNKEISTVEHIIENSQNPNPEHFENDYFNEISPYKETITNKIANKDLMKKIKGVNW